MIPGLRSLTMGAVRRSRARFLPLAAAAIMAAAGAAAVDGASDVMVGRARCARLRAGGFELRKVVTKVEVDGPKWALTDMKAELLGGTVLGRAEIDNTRRPGDVAAFVSVKGADLGALAKKRGDLKGKIEGAADIRWAGASRQLTGALALRVTDGDLGGIPFGVKLFRFLGAPDIFGQRLTSARASVRIAADGLVIESVKIASPNDDVYMVVEEGGTIGWDGKLNLRIQPVIRSKLLSKIPIAGQITQAIIGFLQRRSMRVSVTGSIAEPRMSWSPAN